MSSFEKLCCAFGDVKSAALTTEFAMQTRQPQSSFALETARRWNLTCAQMTLVSKLEIEPYICKKNQIFNADL